MSEPAGRQIAVRDAEERDVSFVVDLMNRSLSPYYGGDHIAHAQRIMTTHLSGGHDRIGHFSFEQRMFITTFNDLPVGMIHVVGKRQGTYKISPLLVDERYRGKYGLGSRLLGVGEDYAKRRGARVIYCTAAQQNEPTLRFFLRRGYIVGGHSESHYKPGITEIMLYKPLVHLTDEQFDRKHISVRPYEDRHEPQVRRLLLEGLSDHFYGIDDRWVDALLDGYKRRHSANVHAKYKLLYVALDGSETVLGVAGATPKKGEPIKIMPLVAEDEPAFVALLTDVPFLLKPYGRRIYIHLQPTVGEAIALQQRGWNLDAALPGAYRADTITQQWSIDIDREDFMRSMRVKQQFLDFIRDGSKTLEVRVGYDAIRTIQPGERIRLESRADSYIVRVKDVRTYPTFENMLGAEAAERIAPGQSKPEVLKLLREIYPPHREKLGVVVLELIPDGVA